MTEIQLLRPSGLVESPAFSHVAVVPPGATTIFIGGQNAVDQDGALVGGADAAAQTKKVMENLVTALAAAGAGIDDLVSVTVVLVEGVDVQAAYAAAAPSLASAKTPPLVNGLLVSSLGVPGHWSRCPQWQRWASTLLFRGAGGRRTRSAPPHRRCRGRAQGRPAAW